MLHLGLKIIFISISAQMKSVLVYDYILQTRFGFFVRFSVEQDFIKIGSLCVYPNTFSIFSHRKIDSCRIVM